MTSPQLPSSNDTGGNCPRCGVYANFTLRKVLPTVYSDETATNEQSANRLRMGNAVTKAWNVTEDPMQNALAVERVLHFVCQRCRKSTLIVESFRTGGGAWVVTDHWPRSGIAVPEDLPEKIEFLFREAASCLQAGAPRGAAIMTRTTIDAALQNCRATGRKTKDRIASLAGQLPQQLIDMAHELRLGGDDAAHRFEDNWSVEDARELMGFLRQLLHHLYEVPRQLRGVQRKTAKRRTSAGRNTAT